jgi:hypothetical protein
LIAVCRNARRVRLRYELTCLVVVGVLPGHLQTFLIGSSGGAGETDGNVRYRHA